MKRSRRVVILGLAALAAILALTWQTGSERTPAPTGAPERETNVPRKVSGSPRRGPWASRMLTDLPSLPAERPPVESPAPGERASASRPKDIIPGEHILSFYDSHDRDAFIKLARARGVEVIGVSDFGYAVRIRTRGADELQRLLTEGPTPVSQGSNLYVRAPKPVQQEPRQPDGPYLGFGEFSLAWLGVNGANADWGKGTTVAVLDTGVISHPSLAELNIRTIDLVHSANAEGDYMGHGTSVASIIGGVGDDIHGIAPGVDILDVRVMSSDGQGDAFTLAQGIVAAVDAGADVINLSLGTHGDNFFLGEAVAYAREKGVVLVAATGNDAVDGVIYPAAYDSVIAVTAVDGNGRHVYFANTGPPVDVAAPGVSINAAGPDDGVIGFSGTSAAVPFVSGTVAMLLAGNPDMTAEEAAAILRDYADDTGAPGADTEYGAGILDVGRIQNRDTPGIYDVATIYPYVPPGRNVPTIVLSVQNRGTEPLAAVDLHVEINGVPSVAHFYDLNVGETTSREFELDRNMLTFGDSVTVKYNALIDGAEDAFPQNNPPMSVTVGLTE